jgi:NTE family protein
MSAAVTEIRPETGASPAGDLAIVLTGGGARAAYQVGVLRGIARHLPQTRFDIITGVSAGAINAVFLGSRPGPLRATVDELTDLWKNLRIEDVFRADIPSLAKHFVQWGLRLVSGGSPVRPPVRGLVDSGPLMAMLRRELPVQEGGEIAGIAQNVERCHPKAVAVTTLNYGTGQTVTWIQGCDLEPWERPLRRSVKTRLTIPHVMASAALPLFFPAVELDDGWYGDGGIRLSAPLSPALHLGAQGILAVSTQYSKSFREADESATEGYPPPAQVLGQLMDAIFLDVLDEDARRLQRSNSILARIPPAQRQGYRVVDLVVLRPSQDLGKLVRMYEPRLPRGFRFLMRSLGTRETSSPDVLSLLMFQPDYLARLIEIGEADAEGRLPEIAALVAGRSIGGQ